MSTLSYQVDSLRLMAKLMRDYGCEEISRILREAADTIINLQDKLHELQIVTDESRYSKLFGTPERAARTLSIMQRCELGIIGNCDECDLHDACRVRDGDYDALLKWLEGSTE